MTLEGDNAEEAELHLKELLQLDQDEQNNGQEAEFRRMLGRIKRSWKLGRQIVEEERPRLNLGKHGKRK